MSPKDRIFVAIDVATIPEATKLLEELQGLVTNVKIGLQLATKTSWKEVIDLAHDRGFKVFCDTKFKDIPNTVEHAAYALTQHGPDYFTVMADNSLEALQAIKRGTDKAVQETGQPAPKIIGVTVLTSISPEESQAIYGDEPKVKVVQFAEKSAEAGLDAIVCSPEEVQSLRANKKLKDLLLITPGVRPVWAASNDQARSATPAGALDNGADALVIGRPITSPPIEVGSPKIAVEKIIEEIKEKK